MLSKTDTEPGLRYQWLEEEKNSMYALNQELKDQVRVLRLELEVVKRVMQEREEFLLLERTVSEITSLAISKHERDLSA